MTLFRTLLVAMLGFGSVSLGQPVIELPSSVFYFRDGERVELKPSQRFFLVDQRNGQLNALDSDTFERASSVIAANHGLVLLKRRPDIGERAFVDAVGRFGGLADSGIALSRGNVDVILVNEFIVRFDSARIAERSLRASGAEVIEQSSRLDNWYLIRFPDQPVLDGLTSINDLARQRGVEYAYPNFVFISPPRIRPDPVIPPDALDAAARVPDVSLDVPVDLALGESWPNDFWYRLGYQKPGLGQIRAREAWEITTGSCDVTIAVLDNGIDSTHEDLKTKIVATLDLIADDGTTGAITSSPSHGTAVAGIAAAATHNDGKGVAGTIWGGEIISGRIIDGNEAGDLSQPAQAQLLIESALALDAEIFNNSWGLTDEMAELGTFDGAEEVIADAIDDGRIFVFAAGNDSTGLTEWPARLAADMDVISVGSIDAFDKLLPDSKSGPEDDSITIVAPGRQIVTTGPSSIAGSSDANPANYVFQFGDSSAAAPFVSGAVALLLSWHPDATPADIRNWLTAGAARPESDVDNSAWGSGRLDIRGALESAGIQGIVLDHQPQTIPVLAAGQSATITVTARRNGKPLGGAMLTFESADTELLDVTDSGKYMAADCQGRVEIEVTGKSNSAQPLATTVNARLHTVSAEIPVSVGTGSP